MKTTLIAAALLSLVSTAAFAGSEDYPAPINTPIYSFVASSNNSGPNGQVFGAGLKVEVNNSDVVLGNGSEAEVDSVQSFPSQPNEKPVYALQAPSPSQG